MEDIKGRLLTFDELKALTEEIDAFLAEVNEKQRENKRLREEELKQENNIGFIKRLRKTFNKQNKN